MQSSEELVGVTGAEKAVDGLIFDESIYSQTESDGHQWWRVDLLALHRVYTILIYSSLEGKWLFRFKLLVIWLIASARFCISHHCGDSISSS